MLKTYKTVTQKQRLISNHDFCVQSQPRSPSTMPVIDSALVMVRSQWGGDTVEGVIFNHSADGFPLSFSAVSSFVGIK